MMNSKRLITAWLAALLLTSLSCRGSAGARDELAVLETNYGRIVMEFFPEDAPGHVARFKQLAREGFYDGTRITRIVKNQSGRSVGFQGGDPTTKNPDKSTW